MREKLTDEDILVADIETKLAGLSREDRERILSRLRIRKQIDQEEWKHKDRELAAILMGKKTPKKETSHGTHSSAGSAGMVVTPGARRHRPPRG